MRTKKRLVALALASLILATGCASNGEAEGAVTDTTGNAEVTTDNAEASTENVTLSFFYYDGLRVFKPTQPIWEFIQAETNITLEGVAPTTTGSDANEQFNLMLAGDIPDIIQSNRDNLLKTGPDLLIPLDDLIKEHAPNIQKMLDENPDVKASSSIDGKIYFIPYLLDGTVSEVMYIRQDWLDKVGLPIPTTTEEYITALTMFKEQDVNGNGKDDEIGFFDRVNTNLNAIGSIYNLHGVSLATYFEDGKVMDDKYTEAFKTSTISIAKMYADGLIDPELFTRGKDARNIMFNENIGGSTVDWVASTGQYQVTYEEQIEGLNWVPMLPPKAENGKAFTQFARSKIFPTGWGISQSCEDTISAIKLFDYLFTDEGSRALNFGIEGDTYTMVDGKAVFTEEMLSGEIPVNDVLMDMGFLQVGHQQDGENEKQWTIPLATQGVELYNEASPYIDTLESLSIPFTSEEIDAKAKIEVALNSYTNEMVQKWVLGSADVEETFDDYLAKVKDLGSQEVLDIYQAAYDRAYK